MAGWQPTSGATPLTDIDNTPEQYFDLVTQFNPGESANVLVQVKFAAGAYGDAHIHVYGRPSGQDWPTEPRDSYRIVAQNNTLKGIDFPVGGLGMYEFRVGVSLDVLGTVNLVSGFLYVQKDNVDLTVPLV